MTDVWLSYAHRYDLSSSKGYGPFAPGKFLGVVVHVNVGKTTDAFFANNPDDVCPNFQIYKDGSIHQYLPLNWQPWCQRAGNQTFAAIETEGYPAEGYTVQQVTAIARVLREYQIRMGLKPIITNSPYQPGIGTHSMGGAAWGGHACPGDIRAAQRVAIIKAMGIPTPAPAPAPVSKAPPWPLPYNHYFGLITGPDESHGGFYASERPFIKLIQQRLQILHFAPTTAGWADGLFEWPTYDAVARWQRAMWAKYTTLYGQVWSDDWQRLWL